MSKKHFSGLLLATIVVAVLVLLVALIACGGPTFRAMNTDPIQVLRIG